MKSFPRLGTERLVLRAPDLEDAPAVQRLADEAEVAAGLLTMPHPYPPGAAEQWIADAAESLERGDGLHGAIVRRSDGAFLGAVGLLLEPGHARAELGYWLGKPHWWQGYATEAARALVRNGFEAEGLNRIFAHHFTRNPASGRVLQKLGMTHEGRRRQHTLKDGEFLDMEAYGMLRSEFEAGVHPLDRRTTREAGLPDRFRGDKLATR